MFCVIALVVLSILGIFSASNRQLAKEALDCVLRRVTLRPCTTGFDEKMKARILGVVIMRSERGALLLNRYFEAISWVFFLSFIVSAGWSVRGGYLFYTTGSCEGANSSTFCIFDPTGQANQISSGVGCVAKPPDQSDMKLDEVDQTGMATLNPQAADKVFMIACYHCEYSRITYPIITALVKRFNPTFTFVNYPVKEQNDYFSRLAYCVNQTAPDAFWDFNDRMFAGPAEQLDDPSHINALLNEVGVNPIVIATCTANPETGAAVQKQLAEVQKTRFYGTPTIFLNGNALVGPKPYRVYAVQLKGLFYWLR